MLRAGTAIHEHRSKDLLSLDLSATKKLRKLPGGRVLNTHLPFRMLPVADIRSKRVKVVHVYRNPRDVLVSMYYHLRQFHLQQTETFKIFMNFFLDGQGMYV